MTIGEILDWFNKTNPGVSKKQLVTMSDEIFVEMFGAKRKPRLRLAAKMYIIGCALFDKDSSMAIRCIENSKQIAKCGEISQNKVEKMAEELIKGKKNEMLFK